MMTGKIFVNGDISTVSRDWHCANGIGHQSETNQLFYSLIAHLKEKRCPTI